MGLLNMIFHNCKDYKPMTIDDADVEEEDEGPCSGFATDDDAAV